MLRTSHIGQGGKKIIAACRCFPGHQQQPQRIPYRYRRTRPAAMRAANPRRGTGRSLTLTAVPVPLSRSQASFSLAWGRSHRQTRLLLSIPRDSPRLAAYEGGQTEREREREGMRNLFALSSRGDDAYYRLRRCREHNIINNNNSWSKSSRFARPRRRLHRQLLEFGTHAGFGFGASACVRVVDCC